MKLLKHLNLFWRTHTLAFGRTYTSYAQFYKRGPGLHTADLKQIKCRNKLLMYYFEIAHFEI